MPRLIATIVLACICLVTTGESMAYAAPLQHKNGFTAASDQQTIVLSVVDVAEEIDNIDPLESEPFVAVVYLHNLGSRMLLLSNSIADCYDASDAPIYLANRRLLI